MLAIAPLVAHRPPMKYESLAVGDLGFTGREPER